MTIYPIINAVLAPIAGYATLAVVTTYSSIAMANLFSMTGILQNPSGGKWVGVFVVSLGTGAYCGSIAAYNVFQRVLGKT